MFCEYVPSDHSIGNQLALVFISLPHQCSYTESIVNISDKDEEKSSVSIHVTRLALRVKTLAGKLKMLYELS